jgi:hypothetical protein
LTTKQECKEILTRIYKQYIEIKIGNFDNVDRAKKAMDGLKQAINITNYINKHVKNDSEIYRTYRSYTLQLIIRNIREGVTTAKISAEETGFISAINDNINQIIDCAEYFHEVELKLLQDLGFEDSHLQLTEMINEVRNRKEDILSSIRESNIQRQLDNIDNRLSDIERQFSRDVERETITKRPGRKLFNLLAKIGPGASLSISNILLAVGAIHYQVSQETLSWGVVQSVGQGLFSMIAVIPDLQNA